MPTFRRQIPRHYHLSRYPAIHASFLLDGRITILRIIRHHAHYHVRIVLRDYVLHLIQIRLGTIVGNFKYSRLADVPTHPLGRALQALHEVLARSLKLSGTDDGELLDGTGDEHGQGS